MWIYINTCVCGKENVYILNNHLLLQRMNNISPANAISRSSPKFNHHSSQPLAYDRYVVPAFFYYLICRSWLKIRQIILELN